MNKHITHSKNKFNLQQGGDLGVKPIASNVAISKVNPFLCVKEKRALYYQKNKDKFKRYYITHKEQVKKSVKRWQKNNLEKVKELGVIYRKKHKDKILSKNKEYYNREDIKEKRKEYNLIRYKNNRESELKRNKDWRINNKEKFYTYRKNLYNTNIQFKLKEILRKRMTRALKKGYKSGSAVKDLGCTILELKFYLENQFKEGMTWANWGIFGWHIDHKKPLDSFNLTNRKELLKAVHYTNLQPLWSFDNWIKSNKYE